jgi:hypothetical protein
MTLDGDEVFKERLGVLRHSSFHYAHPERPELRQALRAVEDLESDLRVEGRLRDWHARVGDHVGIALLFSGLEDDALHRFNVKIRDLHALLCDAVRLALQAYVERRTAQLLAAAEEVS